jgi:hypothetical protein
LFGNPEAAGKKPDFEPPDWVDRELWTDFLETRGKLKAKNTERALKLLVAELEKLKAAGHDPNACIATSIRSSWKDVYAPKPGAANNGTYDRNARLADLADKLTGRTRSGSRVFDG